MKARFLVPFSGICVLLVAASLSAQETPLSPKQEEIAELNACSKMVAAGFLKVPDNRNQRFLGKVPEPTARCRGGMKAVLFRPTPWVDWQNYWGTGDSSTLPVGFLSVKGPQLRGVAGALMDLEYE